MSVNVQKALIGVVVGPLHPAYSHLPVDRGAVNASMLFRVARTSSAMSRGTDHSGECGKRVNGV